MAEPTKVTFPGAVRIEPPPKGAPPLRVKKLPDGKTEVVVPVGWRLTYEERPKRKHEKPEAKPVMVVKVVEESPAEPVHAELHHEDEGGAPVVRAKSTKHEGLEGKGSDAASAVADLKTKLAAKLAPKEEKAPAPAADHTAAVEAAGLGEREVRQG